MADRALSMSKTSKMHKVRSVFGHLWLQHDRFKLLHKVLSMNGRGAKTSIVFFCADNLAFARAQWNALRDDLFPLEVSIMFLHVVIFDTLQELLIATGPANVLELHMNALAELTNANDLRNLHPNRALCDVEDDASAAMIEMVR